MEKITRIMREASVSTNAELIALAQDGAAEFTLLTARSQSGGHGQYGRAFFSPVGGAYFSLLLRPQITEDIAGRVTLTAAVAVCETIEARFGAAARIKPVNDVLINGKKAAGILAEAFAGTDGFFVVLGVGANVAVPDGGFPAELPNAGAITELTAAELPRNAIDHFISEVVTRFLQLYRGDFQNIKRAYDERI